MSLWSLFIALTALAVALSMRAAVWRPKDAATSLPDDDTQPEPSDPSTLLLQLQQRLEALEGEVDDLHRLTTALQEENDILQQRIDAAQSGLRPGGSS